MTVEQVQRGIDQQLREQERQATAERLLEEQLPACVGIGVNRDRRIYMAQELGLEGYIADINLAKMAAVCRKYADRFDGTDNPTLLLNVGLGDELQAGVDVVSVTDATMHPDEIPDGFAEELATAIHCSRERPWKTGDQLIERNLGRIGEDTRDAINSLNPTRLEKHLGFYVELLQHATRLNRDVAADYGRTPAPIADLVDYIYREFYHLLEAAARTGSTDLINTVRGEIFRLSLAYHRQGENYLFEKSIGLYASFYRVLAASPATDPERVHGLLSSMDNIQTMLTADLDRARTVAEVDHVETDLESFYAVLERMLQGTIEEGDARTFNDVWNLGADDFVLVRPESGIYGLQRQIDQAADEAERERLEQELAVKRRQQEVVESVQDTFEETRFVAAAWAYREVREGNFAEPVFREMFSESIKGYSFGALAEVYLRLCTNPRLDLFRWESEDADVFKGVRMSRPAAHTWLQEFFCAMGLLLLDPDEYTGEDVGEPDNPLATIEIERQSYPDFADTIEAVAAEDLARTGVADAELEDLAEKKAVFLALHYQMEERLERREEDQVIDAPLDQDKVADFEERYVSIFTDQFVFRQVLDDLEWLDVQPYNEEIDDRGAGFDVFYPKGGFIPDPPAEFIHHLDQRVWNHIDFILQTWLDAAQDHLAETRIDAYDALPDELAKVCRELAEDGRSPRAIIMGGLRATNVLTDSDNLNTDHQPSDEMIGGFSYNDTTIPVYKDSGSEFDALVLAGSEQPVELTEYRRDDAPVFVKIEKVTRQLLKDLDPEEFDELSDEDIREKLQCVRFRALYYAQFDTSGTFGTKLIVAE